MKKRKNVAPALTWEVLRTAQTYSNITKRCSLCLHEKLAIITYPYLNELLNRPSELVTKSRQENKFLLQNFNNNDWSFEPYDNLRKYNINNIPNGFILLAFSAWVIQQEQNKDIFKLIWKCLFFLFLLNCLGAGCWQDESIWNIVYNEWIPYYKTLIVIFQENSSIPRCL